MLAAWKNTAPNAKSAKSHRPVATIEPSIAEFSSNGDGCLRQSEVLERSKKASVLIGTDAFLMNALNGR